MFFFPLWVHMTFVPLFYIYFLPSKWEKNLIIYLFFEWFYVTWKQEYHFVLYLLPTWASIWHYTILEKKIVVLASQK
jgi:hypothetical protein